MPTELAEQQIPVINEEEMSPAQLAAAQSKREEILDARRARWGSRRLTNRLQDSQETPTSKKSATDAETEKLKDAVRQLDAERQELRAKLKEAEAHIQSAEQEIERLTAALEPDLEKEKPGDKSQGSGQKPGSKSGGGRSKPGSKSSRSRGGSKTGAPSK